jgi:hypothetical protein
VVCAGTVTAGAASFAWASCPTKRVAENPFSKNAARHNPSSFDPFLQFAGVTLLELGKSGILHTCIDRYLFTSIFSVWPT